MKTLTEYEKQKIEELSTILYEVMLKQKPYVKNFPLGQLEKRVSDFLLETIRETEERTRVRQAVKFQDTNMVVRSLVKQLGGKAKVAMSEVLIDHEKDLVTYKDISTGDLVLEVKQEKK